MIAVFQFDAVDVPLVERMLAEGRLPTLASLRARGEWRRLESPAVDLAAASFQTLYTGLEPGEHGHFYPFQWVASEGRIRLAGEIPFPPPVWERASRAGRRVLVVDPYESQVPSQIPNGIAVSGVGFVERVVLPRWAVPAAAGRSARRLVGRPPTVTETFGRPTAGELSALTRDLSAAPRRTAAAAAAELRSGRYDLAWVGLSAGHLAGHQLRELEGAVERVYEATDAALGELAEALPAGAQTIVVSPLGMDHNSSRADLLPGMLAAVLSGQAPAPGAGGGLWRMRAALPRGLRSAAASAMPDRVALGLTTRLETRGIDHAAEAFALPADGQGFVRLNLREREPDGVVDPGRADELCARIEAGLRGFSDIGGGLAVDRVVRAAAAYPGERSDWLPDLIVGWSDRPSARLAGVVSSELGEVRRQGVGSGRVGNHPGRADAWALSDSGAVEAQSLASVGDVARAISRALELESHSAVQSVI